MKIPKDAIYQEKPLSRSRKILPLIFVTKMQRVSGIDQIVESLTDHSSKSFETGQIVKLYPKLCLDNSFFQLERSFVVVGMRLRNIVMMQTVIVKTKLVIKVYGIGRRIATC